MKYCNNCRTDNPANANYCRKCGSYMEDTPPPPPSDDSKVGIIILKVLLSMGLGALGLWLISLDGWFKVAPVIIGYGIYQFIWSGDW